MVRFRFLGLGLLGVAVAIWTACSGDDQTSSTSIGGEGQACLPGSSCIAGLECINGKCVTVSVGPGKGDGGVLYTGNPKATPADCEDISQAAQPLCPTPDAGDALCTDQARLCCAGQGCVAATVSCNAPEGKWECFATSQCTSVASGHCCITGAAGPGSACQGSTLNPAVGSVCTGGADTPCDPEFELELCSADSDCAPNAPCTKTVLTFKGVAGEDYTKTVGYCLVPPVPSDGGGTGPKDAGHD